MAVSLLRRQAVVDVNWAGGMQVETTPTVAVVVTVDITTVDVMVETNF